MYKAHIRNVGQNQYVITEFINDVSWDRDPYSTINAATMHHIYEGRWLKDNRFIDGYINYMFQQGGNNRSYSESVADAAFARYLVNADSNFIMQQLDSMKYVCGSADNTFLIPFLEFEPFVKNMWTTENEERIYWHVVIHKRDNKFLLAQPRNEKQDLLDITKYKI